MPYVITQKCMGERYAACVDVCPVDCIHPIETGGKPYMVIDPEVCIECDACLPECPVGAIVSSAAEDKAAAELNANLAPQAIEWEKTHGRAPARPSNDPPRRPDNTLVHFGHRS